MVVPLRATGAGMVATEGDTGARPLLTTAVDTAPPLHTPEVVVVAAGTAAGIVRLHKRPSVVRAIGTAPGAAIITFRSERSVTSAARHAPVEAAATDEELEAVPRLQVRGDLVIGLVCRFFS